MSSGRKGIDKLAVQPATLFECRDSHITKLVAC
jgi:hypothetical protein